MASPFPGMDPYLETQPRWEIFHGWFIHKLAELALPRAASMGCWIDVERNVYGVGCSPFLGPLQMRVHSEVRIQSHKIKTHVYVLAMPRILD
jgi:Protein of unknown function (DUF4058)